ncbi:MAG: hypothetical protein WD934_11785 [Gemmatimonadales bacterium]
MNIPFVLAALVAVPSLSAQDHDHGQRPEQLGRVTFPTSCAQSVQPRFERAMALLHSFWWEESRAAFTEIATAEPRCAMAWWGLALAWWDNPFAPGPAGASLAQGAEAAQRAAAVRGVTGLERGYVRAVATLYRDHATTPNAARLRAYSDVLASLHQAFPHETEAAIYYALSLVATASPTDTTFTRQRQAHAILEPLFLAQPDHPGLAHYVIHANDSPYLAQQGLRAARAYAGIAPSVPHAQHMPSHIFIRLGYWQENIEANRRSYEAGATYARAQGWQGLGAHEFHAMDYMVYGYLQLGEDSAARHWTNHALSVTHVTPAGSLVAEYSRAAMPARMMLERDRWREAAALPALAQGPAPARMVNLFARGLGAARSGAVAAAQQAIAGLNTIQQALAASDPYWARVAGIKVEVVTAWVLLAQGDTAGALAAARSAADTEDVTEKHPVTPGEVLPARELYGDLLFATGRVAEAREAWQATLTREPGRARSIAALNR